MVEDISYILMEAEFQHSSIAPPHIGALVRSKEPYFYKQTGKNRMDIVTFKGNDVDSIKLYQFDGTRSLNLDEDPAHYTGLEAFDCIQDYLKD